MSAPLIDAWLFDLDRPAHEIAAHAESLDTNERDRAASFRLARDRDRYIARHGQVRRLLGDHLGRPPATIRIMADAMGKPAVADADIAFSVSKSHGLALCAIARGIALGCDIERRDPRLAEPATARRFFTSAELGALDRLDGEGWTRGFFDCWTRKEAYVKAIGLGLSYPLGAFDVSLAPGAPAAFTRGGEGWSIHAFAPDADHHAAVVAQGRAAESGVRVRRLGPIEAAARAGMNISNL